MRLWQQLDIFKDWTPPPPQVPRPLPQYARRDLAERSMDQALHERPDPVKVYRQSITHGFDSCAGRWWWCSRTDLGRLISQGRAIIVGKRSAKARRSLTAEQEADVVATVQELGGVAYAASALSLNESIIRTVLREKGVAYPRASIRAADRAAAAERLAAWTARRAA
ncbi:hypothetical protein [Methylobacterium sp. SD21]|uniref:hypothetical protein n=1 Tax=Methylobacterium litchii TaxID=3138810 RepID=UPI00313CAB84